MRQRSQLHLHGAVGRVPFDLIQDDAPLTVGSLKGMAVQKEKRWQHLLCQVRLIIVVPQGQSVKTPYSCNPMKPEFSRCGKNCAVQFIELDSML